MADKMSLGISTLASLVSEDLLSHFLKLDESYFWQHEVGVYKKVKRHVNKYNTLPSFDLFKKMSGVKSPPKDLPQFWVDKLSERALFNKLDGLLPIVHNKLKAQKVKEAHAAVLEYIDYAYRINTGGSGDLTTLQTLMKGAVADLKAAQFYSGGLTGIPTGWSTLDEITLGYQKAEQYLLTARPKMGKSFLIRHSILASHFAGFRPLEVSMEMRGKQQATRNLAMITKKPFNSIRTGRITSFQEAELLQIVDEFDKGPPVYFLDGQFRQNVDDIKAAIYVTEPDIVFIDGAYLVHLAGMSFENQYAKNSAEWETMKRVAEQLKNLCSTMNIPMVNSFQLKRPKSKRIARTMTTSPVKTKPELAGLEDIQLSDVIGQLASLAIGVFNSEDVNPELSQEMSLRYVEILGVRDGVGSGFFINWDFENMDFSEYGVSNNSSTESESEPLQIDNESEPESENTDEDNLTAFLEELNNG